MTQLVYEGSNQKVIESVEEANRILQLREFYDRIAAVPRFDNSSYSPQQVSDELHNFDRTIAVQGYWNILSLANASTQTEININTAKLRRSKTSIVNTLIHETVHAIDWLTNKAWDYTHDGNSPAGQDQTAPWVIGALAEGMVK